MTRAWDARELFISPEAYLPTGYGTMDGILGGLIAVFLIVSIAMAGVLMIPSPEKGYSSGSLPPVTDTGTPLIKGFLSPPCQTVPLIWMCDTPVQLPEKTARGFVYPLGPANLVAVVTDVGMVGCGAFDVAALERFNYPAARVKPSRGDSITSIDDLLVGIVKDANGPAQARGVKVGMTGREALERL